MTLLARRALYFDGSWGYYFDPRGLTVSIEDISVIEAAPMRFRDATGKGLITTYAAVHGYQIAINGLVLGSSIANGMTGQEALINALVDEDGIYRTIHYCHYADTDKIHRWIYRDCVATGLPKFGPVGDFHGMLMASFELSLNCQNPTRYATEPTGATIPPAGPYEAYIIGGEAAAEVTNVTRIPISFFLPGAEAADSSNVGWAQQRIQLSSTMAFSVKTLQLQGLAYTGASNTIVTVADKPYSDIATANKIQLTINANTATATPASGSFTVAAGGYVYIYITTAGGHGDLRLSVGVQSA